LAASSVAIMENDDVHVLDIAAIPEALKAKGMYVFTADTQLLCAMSVENATVQNWSKSQFTTGSEQVLQYTHHV